MQMKETESKEEIIGENLEVLTLSQYGTVIRQQSGNFFTEYGSRIKVGFTGLSDLQFISDDGKLIVFIEIKKTTGKTREEQENFINFINNKKSPNLKAGIARSVEDALKLIEKNF